MKRARFPIGLQFHYYADRSRVSDPRTIVDILTTTNSTGAIVRVEYVTTRDFLGQALEETFPDAAIARSLTITQVAELGIYD